MIYEVEVNGEVIKYGADIKRSRFSSEEWDAIYHEMVKVNAPDVYRVKKEDNDYIQVRGSLIDMEERYEALLELLPQDSFSKAGTHPEWVADAVEGNTLMKDITKDDVKDAILRNDTYEDLKSELVGYFELEGMDE